MPAQGNPKFIGLPVITVKTPPFLGVGPVGAAAAVVVGAGATEVGGIALSVGRIIVGDAAGLGAAAEVAGAAAEVAGPAAEVAGAAAVGFGAVVVLPPPQAASSSDITIKTLIATPIIYLPFILCFLLYFSSETDTGQKMRSPI